MKLLDEKGLTTVWSVCKEKFALAGHTHNYAGSGSAGGSANSAIGVVDYGQTDKTIQIGYSGAGITGGQIKFIAGYTDGGGNVNAKIKDVSKDALKAWLDLGSLAYSSASIPTKLSQLTNDKGFVTGSVSGNTVTINGTSTTWSNTWRGIQDNLTSSSKSDSLSANQGRVLKSLVDGKANSSDLSSYAKKNEAASMELEIIVRQYGVDYSTQYISITSVDKTANKSFAIDEATTSISGLMSAPDKRKLDGIANGANNYTLPAASEDTFGGIKASSPYIAGYNFPICVNEDNKAYTRISGLDRGERGGGITGITVSNDDSSNFSTKYKRDEITVYRNTEGYAYLHFPFKSGTFALTSECNLTVMSSDLSVTNGKYMVGFESSQQTVLLESSGNYDISNWYSQCSIGDVLDMYSYGLQGGVVSASQSNLFRIMKGVSGGPQLSAENSITIYWNKHIRMIRTNGAVFVCTYTLNN